MACLELDKMYCLHCMYDLRDLRVPCCPECGAAFDPNDPETYRLERVEPKREWVHFLTVWMSYIFAAIVLLVIAAFMYASMQT